MCGGGGAGGVCTCAHAYVYVCTCVRMCVCVLCGFRHVCTSNVLILYRYWIGMKTEMCCGNI